MAGQHAALNHVVLNPRGAGDFGRRHVILNGRTSKPMHMASFAGPFSIKSVIHGRAVWQTEHGRYALAPGRHLILNAGTAYSLTIDGRAPVETFCVFFQDGFIEQALRSVTTPDAVLLDAPEDRAESFALLESIHDSAGALGAQLSAMHRMITDDGVGALPLSGVMQTAAVTIVGRSAALTRLSRRLPATRAATRRELVRRLQQARDFMRDQLAGRLALTDIARAACLSSFHFHRSFRMCFGETPHQYVLRLRLEDAASRLRRSRVPVTDIALAVGFENPAHFSRAFKRRFHCTAQDYRRTFGR
jgi:AraC family transcriptional regulator